ncbi:MAG: flagellar hook-associated protein FlgK [bacterium]
MLSTFLGIEIAKQALFAQRTAMDVTAHNVANANTPGYSREEGIMTTSPSVSLVSIGTIGTGVNVDYVRRIRDEFTDIQYRDENRIKSYWDNLSQNIGQVEGVLNEPSENSISSAIDAFWNSWKELSTNPESMSVRVSLEEQAQNFISILSHTRSELVQLGDQLSKDLEGKINTVNDIAIQIGALNEEIKRATIKGQSLNDLLDRRDVLIDSLSELINFDMRVNENNEVIINIRDHILVGLNNTVNKLEVSNRSVVWQDGTPVYIKPEQGEISNILDAMNNIVGKADDSGYTNETGYIQVIDRLVEAVYTRVNEVHQGGYGIDNTTGIPFFSLLDPTKGIVANNIKLNDDIVKSPEKIAAASTIDSPGDGSNALGLSNISNEFLIDNSFTVGDYWASQVGALGIISQRANWMSENQKVLVDALIKRRESTSGVSLDEEMVNMIRYQNAFSAASRILTVIDEMLSTLIEKTGVVGR